MSILGKRLKQARKKAGYTQEHLANLLGTTYQTISNYERGTRDPDTDNLNRLAGLLSISTDYLLGRTDDPAPPRSTEKKEPLYVDYVLAAPDLGEALIRVSNTIAKYRIDTHEAKRISDLAFQKFGAPKATGHKLKAAHTEHKIPGTGALDNNDTGVGDDEDRN